MHSDMIPLDDEAILQQLALQPNRWLLRDIIVLAHGYDYRLFNWKRADGNAAPRRPYENAEIAVDRNELRGRKDAGEYQVIKRDFVDWLKREYGTLNTFQRFISLYEHYKAQQKIVRPVSFFVFAKTPNPSQTMILVWNKAYDFALDCMQNEEKFRVKDAARHIAKEINLPETSITTYISQGGIRQQLLKQNKIRIN